MSWFEGVYEDGFYIGGGGGSDPFGHYGTSPTNPAFRYRAENMSTFLPGPGLGGGGGGGGGGIDINIPIGGGGGGGPRPPDTSQTLTAIVNWYEQQLINNLGMYNGGQRTATAALAEGWRLMDAMVTDCLRYGAEGQKAAAERDRRINPSMLRWDWIAYYLDPIVGAPISNPPPPPGGGVNPPAGVNPGGGGVNPPGMFNFDDPMVLGLLALFVIVLVTRK